MLSGVLDFLGGELFSEFGRKILVDLAEITKCSFATSAAGGLHAAKVELTRGGLEETHFQVLSDGVVGRDIGGVERELSSFPESSW